LKHGSHYTEIIKGYNISNNKWIVSIYEIVDNVKAFIYLFEYKDRFVAKVLTATINGLAIGFFLLIEV